MNKLHYLKGMVRSLFNPNVSFFSFISSTSKLSPSAVVYRGVKIKYASVADYTYISNNTDVENATIGKFCSIADHCRIGLANHTLDLLSTSPVFTLANNAAKTKWVEDNVDTKSSKKVIVGNDVWIGSHALILGGVKIGDGAVIGAGAVVTKDVPPYAIVGGVPASIIRFRFSQEIIDKLLEVEWWNIPKNKLCNIIDVFHTSQITLELLDRIAKGISK